MYFQSAPLVNKIVLWSHLVIVLVFLEGKEVSFFQ